MRVSFVHGGCFQLRTIPRLPKSGLHRGGFGVEVFPVPLCDSRIVRAVRQMVDAAVSIADDAPGCSLPWCGCRAWRSCHRRRSRGDWFGWLRVPKLPRRNRLRLLPQAAPGFLRFGLCRFILRALDLRHIARILPVEPRETGFQLLKVGVRRTDKHGSDFPAVPVRL